MTTTATASQSDSRATNKPRRFTDGETGSSHDTKQAPLIDVVFGSNATIWLARQEKATSNAEVLSKTVAILAADERLRMQLEHPNGEHTMATVLRRCVELELELGTKNIRCFHKALTEAGVPCDSVIMTLESLLMLTAGISHPKVQSVLIDAKGSCRSSEDRLVDFVMALDEHGFLGKSQHLGHIYSGLPAEIKAVTKNINLPLSELRALRQNLKHPAITAFLSSEKFKGLSKEDAFVELVSALDEHQLLGSSQNLGQIYSGLPAEIKAVTKQINLPLSDLRALRQNLKNSAITALLSSEMFKGLSKEDAFVELVSALDERKLLGNSQNLGHIYSGLPAEIKAITKKINLPLSELRALRQSLKHSAITALLSSETFKGLSKEDAFVELVSALDEHTLLGSSQNLGQIYSGLPAEIKAVTTYIDLPFSELRALRHNLKNSAITALLSSEKFKGLSKEDAFVELVSALDERKLLGNSQNLGNIYSGLPAEIKAVTKYINLPLSELRALRHNLKNSAITALLSSETFKGLSKEDAFVELVSALDEHKLLGSSQNLSHIYSGLPAEIKAVTKKIGLPLRELRALRQNLKHSAITALLSSETFKGLSKEDAFVELVSALDEHNLLGSSQNLGQIYSGLPAEIKAVTKCINLPLSELRALRQSLTHSAITALLSSETFKGFSKEDAFVELVSALDEHQLLGSSQNLGQIYSGLPAEIKAVTKHINLPLSELRALRQNLKHSAITALLSSETFKGLSKEDAFVELVSALDEHNLLGGSQNLGQIYSGLPAEIKAVTKQINLPLSDLRALRHNLKNSAITALLSSEKFKGLSKEDAFVELVSALDEHKLLGSSQNLGQIYSGLPAEIKAVTKQIGLPLAELRSIQSFLRLPTTVAWIEATLPDYPREERLQLLLEQYNSDTDNKTNRQKLFQALPNNLSPSIYKGDLTTASLRLDLPEQTVFFDSNEERVVAQLLFKYGLVEKFIEGRNLHVISGNSRISLDFKIGNVFLEYHPLSRRERDAGLSLEEAGERKKSSVSHERYPDHEVIHIWKLEQLHEVLVSHPVLSTMLSPEFRSLSKAAFLKDVRAAKAQGHKIDRAVKASRALAV
jgi:acyl-CoA-binding protein